MDFLQTVTSRNGKNLIFGVAKDKNKKPVERWVDFSDATQTNNAIDQVAAEYDAVYFALGAFNSNYGGPHRRAVNCNALRAFWLDVDAGQEKWDKHNGKGCYRTLKDAIIALYEFVKLVHLPIPTYIVGSGTGLHVYWALDEDIPTDKWHDLALVLKAAHNVYGFKADNTRTADAASVLRPVGTRHAGSGNIVTIGFQGKVVSSTHMQEVLNNLRPYVQDLYRARKEQALGLGAVPSYLKDFQSSVDKTSESKPTSFGKIIRQQEIEKNGCKQLYDIYENQRHISEPYWAAALSICRFCVDGEEWAVKISQDHPEYEHDLTMKKMNQFDGPRTCAWFKLERPELCEGCPHLSMVEKNPNISPIVLGSDPDQGVVVVEDKIHGANSDEKEEFIIPSYPFPYKRLPNGGIIKHETSPDSDETAIVDVYPFDFYISDRIAGSATEPPKFWARLHTPHDGVLEMELTSDDIYAQPTSLAKALAAKGILTGPGQQMVTLSNYLRTSVMKLQSERAMLNPPRQMGWTTRGTFILGRSEYTKAGVRVTPVVDTNIASTFAAATVSRGKSDIDLRGWNEALIALYGADDADVYRMVLASGIGAPIRSLCSNDPGGMLNVFSEDSGLGKTTLTKVMCGIYGDPEPFVLQAKHGTTANAFFEMISYVNSIPLVLDEVGQMNADELMQFVHTCTSGKAKARGASQTNDIRVSSGGWRTFVLSSSNVSLWNRIMESRVENEAYVMRVAEVPITQLSHVKNKAEGDENVRRIQQYYGAPGAKLLPYLVNNRDRIEQLWKEKSALLAREAKLGTMHRFWADMLTAAVVGAIVGYEAGIFPFSVSEVERVAIRELKAMKSRYARNKIDDSELFTSLITSNWGKLLVIEAEDAIFPGKLPYNEITMRYEKHTSMLYITRDAVQMFAQHRQFAVDRINSFLIDMGARQVEVALFANTQGPDGISMRSWAIDMTKFESIKKMMDQARINFDESSNSTTSTS